MGLPMCPGCRALLDPGQDACPYCGWNVALTETRRRGGMVERAARAVGGLAMLLVLANVLGACLEAIAEVRIRTALDPEAGNPLPLFLRALMDPSGGIVGFLGAVTPGEVLGEGQAWRLMTCMFLHFGVLHLGMNMVSLWNVGGLVEEAYGTGKALALYLLTGLAGSALALGWFALQERAGWAPEPFAMAGASGAVCGYAGILAALGHRVGGPEGRRMMWAMVKPVAVILVIGVVLDLTGSSFRLANAAHLGGFLAGLAAGRLCDFGIRARGNPAAVRAWDAAALLLALATLASAIPPTLSIGEALK